MDALILSCSTGGGHNAAGRAIKEELERRGHNVVMFDPYTLYSGTLSGIISNLYINIAQKTPHLFGLIYSIGNAYRKLPFKSPVYFFNHRAAVKLNKYLQNNHFDVIVTPHLYPAEMITQLKNMHKNIPLSIFIATDYVCIPFTEETDCDYYVIPTKESENDFIKRGIPKDKLLPFGIPVIKEFNKTISADEAKKVLGLNADTDYYLMTGGSIGAGSFKSTAAYVHSYVSNRANSKMILICGNNDKLYKTMHSIYGNDSIVLKSTKHMALYMKACKIFFSKPGGLSSTESAVSRTPTVHFTPIPGCENYNRNFFTRNGLSLKADDKASILSCINLLNSKENIRHMKIQQSLIINANACDMICDFIDKYYHSHY